jgi:DNA-binding MarR family transcriptional regulator
MATVEQQVRALDLLLELSLLLNEDMTAGLARDGLTTSRTKLLWVLGTNGPMTQRALAEALGVSARNVTGLVDALEATGFVTREPHPTDRRASLVSFTEHGAAVLAKLQDGRHEFARLLFGELPERRLGHLVDGLTDVRDRLRDAMTPAEG